MPTAGPQTYLEVLEGLLGLGRRLGLESEGDWVWPTVRVRILTEGPQENILITIILFLFVSFCSVAGDSVFFLFTNFSNIYFYFPFLLF